MARRFYSDHRVYDAINDLKAVMKDLWESLWVGNVQKLYRSLSRRLLAVIDAEGGDSKY